MLAPEGHMLLSYSTNHRRRTNRASGRPYRQFLPPIIGAPLHVNMAHAHWTARGRCSYLVNYSDCDFKVLSVLAATGLVASCCGRRVIDQGRTGNCGFHHVDSVVPDNKQAGTPRLRNQNRFCACHTKTAVPEVAPQKVDYF